MRVRLLLVLENCYGACRGKRKEYTASTELIVVHKIIYFCQRWMWNWIRLSIRVCVLLPDFPLLLFLALKKAFSKIIKKEEKIKLNKIKKKLAKRMWADARGKRRTKVYLFIYLFFFTNNCLKYSPKKLFVCGCDLEIAWGHICE